MSTIYIKDIGDTTKLGLWKIDRKLYIDTVSDKYTSKVRHDECSTRKVETAAVYALLHKMTGRNDFSIDHEVSGKPFICIGDLPVACNISISHTKGFASILLSESSAVAVDIEYRSDRIKRIATRFLRTEELENIKNYKGNDLLTILLLHWCAKETLFKLYSDARLTFQNIYVDDIYEICEHGHFTCINLLNGERQTIQYEQNSDFVITYCTTIQ